MSPPVPTIAAVKPADRRAHPARAFCLDGFALVRAAFEQLQNRELSVGLISYHFTASRKAGQDRGFGFALGQEHETVTFIGMGSAPLRGPLLFPSRRIAVVVADFSRLRFRC
jgi:hypothetical protein